MPPVLRPRTPKRAEAKQTKPAAKASPERPRDDGNFPPARSFALSSSGWLFVYYVGVVKALAERGYHKCAPISSRPIRARLAHAGSAFAFPPAARPRASDRLALAPLKTTRIFPR